MGIVNLKAEALSAQRFEKPTQFTFCPLWDGLSAAAPVQKLSPALPVIRVQLVREQGEAQLVRPRFDTAEEFAVLLHLHLADVDREHFVVILLDTQMALIGLHTVSIGTLNATLVSARDVFKAAILANAACIVVGHNHPSGDPEPSPEDIHVTNVLRKAGALFDIEVVDHIVIGEFGAFVSIRRRGHFVSSLQERM